VSFFGKFLIIVVAGITIPSLNSGISEACALAQLPSAF